MSYSTTLTPPLGSDPRTLLLPLQKKLRNRNMTQRKWVQVVLQRLLARGIALALDELPRRYVSREFLTL